jgi:NTP pyrophosphatase (non-canonical NTP hydrolase)
VSTIDTKFINNEKTFAGISSEIHAERLRQIEKWGDNDETPEKYFLILGEEVGEVSNALLEGDADNYREELVQVAAVCVRTIQSFDRARAAKADSGMDRMIKALNSKIFAQGNEIVALKNSQAYLADQLTKSEATLKDLKVDCVYTKECRDLLQARVDTLSAQHRAHSRAEAILERALRAACEHNWSRYCYGSSFNPTIETFKKRAADEIDAKPACEVTPNKSRELYSNG